MLLVCFSLLTVLAISTKYIAHSNKRRNRWLNSLGFLCGKIKFVGRVDVQSLEGYSAFHWAFANIPLECRSSIVVSLIYMGLA